MNDNHGREWTFAFRDKQHAGELDPLLTVLESDLLVFKGCERNTHQAALLSKTSLCNQDREKNYRKEENSYNENGPLLHTYLRDMS
jgi:hypothetical protein